MDMKTEDMVEMELNGKKVAAPVWIQAGHPDNSVSVFLGYGRRRAGALARAQVLTCIRCATARRRGSPNGVKITKAGGNYQLAIHSGLPVHGHARRCIPPTGSQTALEEYHKEPNFAREESPQPN